MWFVFFQLNSAENAGVEKVEGGLKFTWNKSTAWHKHTEQVMMMAYFPELQEAIYITSGARRSKGEDILEIKPSRIDAKMETYNDSEESMARNRRVELVKK